ncbi:MAG: right-handed parallel beta-helix repeat-containing protein [Sphingomonadales bacterium]|jgi:hypothetical protein
MAIKMQRIMRPGVTALFASAMLASASQAATYQANATTLATVMAQAVGGDTIILSGAFPETNLRNLTYTVPLVLDARAAQFPGGLNIRDSMGITVKGGTFGSATILPRIGRGIDINGGGNIRVEGSAFQGVAGVGTGLLARNADRITVTKSTFTGLKLGLGVQTVSTSALTNNVFTNNSSDGINVADSRVVSVTGNICRGGSPAVGAHPDCVQLWSVAGQPVQSSIRVVNNKAYGPTQGFTSFDPETASGRALTFESNYLATSFPQGIACYGCVNSIFRNNTLVTLPEAQWRTSLNVVGGSGNTIIGNQFFDNRIAQSQDGEPAVGMDNLLANIDLLWPDFGSLGAGVLEIDGSAFGTVTNSDLTGVVDVSSDVTLTSMAMRGMAPPVSGFSAAVPEPASWALWISGFGLAGLGLRRRRVPAHG